MRALDHEELHGAEAIPPHIFTGRILNNSYKIGPLIEQGAIAEIYDCTEISTGDHFAIKILLPQLARDPKIQAVFLNEARTLGRLSQPGLPRYRTCATDPASGLTYIVTDLLGLTLATHLSAWQPNEREILGFTTRLALALSAAHESGLVHGHLSPDNIRVPGGKLAHAVIVNFGLSGYFDSGSRLPADIALDGTYFAPEQLRALGGQAVISPCTDVYSLALVVLAVACGKSPDTMTRRNGVPDLSPLPRSLRPVFERMLAPDPKKRFAGMAEIVEALDADSGAARPRRTGRPVFASVLQHVQRAAIAGTQALAASTVQRTRTTPTEDAPRAKAQPVAKPAAQPVAQPVVPLAAALPPPRAPRFTPVTSPRPRVSLAAAHTTHSSRAIRAAGLAGVALAAVMLVGVFMGLHAMFPSKIAVTRTAPVDDNVYGAEAQDSRFTLSVRRPVQLTVFAGKDALWERAMQPGELYRAPNLADLAVTATDAGAVEVMFDGKSIGFVGKDRAAVRQVPLRRLLASAVGPLVTTDNKAKPAKPAPAPARSQAPAPPAVVFAPPPPPVPAAPRFVEPIPAPPAPAAIATITEPPPSTVPQTQPSAAAVSTSVVQSIIALQAATAQPVAQPEPAAVVSERERAKSTAAVAKAVKDLEKQRAQSARRYNNAMRNSVYGLPHP